MAETWTLGRLLQWTTDYLQKQGSDSPRLDAEVLLAHCRGCQRIALYTAFDEVASDDLRTKFRELVKQRAEGMPVAYLVGEREFYSLRFLVTSAVLIPRPETEFLVIRALDLLKQLPTDHVPQVVDVGTGSGCIAISVAKHAPRARFIAIDQSTDALAVAARNAELHGVKERIDFVSGDLLSTLPAEPAFDLILSNPPYIGEGELAGLPRTVRDYEPRAALIAGPTGVELIARLVPQAVACLRPGGTFLCEISPLIEPTVTHLLAAVPELEVQPTIRDFAQHPRVVEARRR